MLNHEKIIYEESVCGWSDHSIDNWMNKYNERMNSLMNILINRYITNQCVGGGTDE